MFMLVEQYLTNLDSGRYLYTASAEGSGVIKIWLWKNENNVFGYPHGLPWWAALSGWKKKVLPYNVTYLYAGMIASASATAVS